MFDRSITKSIHIILLIILAVLTNLFRANVHVMEIYLIFVYAFVIYSCIKVLNGFSSLYFYFVIYLFLCNAGQTLLHAFNIEWIGLNVYSLYGNDLVLNMVYFQCLCIVFLQIGALCMHDNTKLEYAEAKEYYVRLVRSYSSSVLAYYAYIIVSMIMIIQYTAKVFTRASMGYGEFYYSESSATGVSLLLTVAFFILLFSNIWFEQSDNRKNVVYCFAGIIVVLMLIIGARSQTIPILVGILYLRRLKGLSIGEQYSFVKKVRIIIAGIALIFLLSVIGEYRNLSLSDFSGMSLGSIFGGGFFRSMINLIQEMGASSRCTLETISRIEASGTKDPTIVYAVLKAFINTKVLSVFGMNIPVENLSTWVTRMGSGQLGTGAWGYSIIAEAYYDYGQFGFLIMFFLGAMWSTLERLIRKGLSKGHVFSSMAGVYLLSYLVFAARSELLLYSVPARYCFYIAILCMAFRHGLFGNSRMK